MKKILALLLALVAASPAQEIEELQLASGKFLKDVVISSVSKDGVKLKSRTGSQTLKFEDISPEAATLIGAKPLPPSPEGYTGVLDMQRQVIEFDATKLPDETKSQHAARVARAKKDARLWADDNWRAAERAESLAAEQAKEGIDTSEAKRKAADARGLAISFEFAFAKASAKPKAGK